MILFLISQIIQSLQPGFAKRSSDDHLNNYRPDSGRDGRGSSHSKKRHFLTRMHLTLQDTSQRTNSKQRLEFSLLETTYLRFLFSQPEHGNISKPVYLIQDASALLSLRFLAGCVRSASMIKEEEIGIRYASPYIILSNQDER